MITRSKNSIPRVATSSALLHSFGIAAIFVGMCSVAQAQVTVSPNTLNYTTLKQAFDAINQKTHTGAVTVTITADTTETLPAVLNASGPSVGNGNYTSITITPSGARTVSGAIAAGSALIDLNGADNVTINGLKTPGNSLTITNTTVSSTAGTSTIRLRNDASANTITNAVIQGSSTMAAPTNGGTIWISDGTTTGNDNNTVSGNDIGPAGLNLPSQGLYFSNLTGNTNDGNAVTSNNIFDYFSASVDSAGVYVGSGTPVLNLSFNRFYQTATRTQTTGRQHSAIWINNSSSSGYTITGNIIGFANSGGSGTYNFVGVAGSNFKTISLAVGTTVSTILEDNNISAIAQSGDSSGSSTSAPFIGIYVDNGLVKIGDTSGNTIGTQGGTGSITYSSSNNQSSSIYGIFKRGNANFTTNKNIIGGITASSTNSFTSISVFGITNLDGATWTAERNIIGGGVANSIQSTAIGTSGSVQGMVTGNTTGAVINLTGNAIRNLASAGGLGQGLNASLIGIAVSGNAGVVTLTNNNIYSLSNSISNVAQTPIVSGIEFTGSSGANLIDRNLISGLSVVSPLGLINGINISGGTALYRNNMVILGKNVSGVDITAGIGINGINETGGTNTLLNNSILITGSNVEGASSTYAFQSIQTTTRNIQNNNFYNARSNNGLATGKHYAIRTANQPNLTSNYNNIFVSGTGGVFGRFNNIDQGNLSLWRIASSQDANSISVDPLFTCDLHLSAASPSRDAGELFASVNNDFDGQSRPNPDTNKNDIGADEYYINANFFADGFEDNLLGCRVLPASQN
jgi:trimeric autotransporter adhesin